MKRIFVAVDISDEARARASAYTDALRSEFPSARVGWEKPEKLHLTLKFLGDTTDAQLDELNETVRETAARIDVFKLRIQSTGVFPSARNARILWLGVGDERRVLAAASELMEIGCEKIGFPREKRNFRAHLTIGRLREPHRSGEIAEKHLQNEFSPVEFDVSELVVYESVLQPRGSIYSVVAKYEFKRQDTFDAEKDG